MGLTRSGPKFLLELPLDKIDRTYYFETSMLANLYLIGAVVKDVPMPARYQGEVSSLLVHRILFEFPPKLFSTFLRRLVLKNFIYDFSMGSIYLLAGLPLLLFRFDLWHLQMDPVCEHRHPRAHRHSDAPDSFGTARYSIVAFCD